ncbi:MAG: hypothetical protein ACI8WT_000866 [Clostridium sp.]
MIYHGSYCLVDKPHINFLSHQMCIVNQEIIDKYLKYEGSKEV